MKLLCYVRPLKLTIEIDDINDQCDRLLNTHWFVLISKIKIIDEWLNRSQETLLYDQMKSENPNQFHHMKFIIQILHTVNQLKTDHPQPFNHMTTTHDQPNSWQYNHMITMQQHLNGTQPISKSNHFARPQKHNQSPDTHYLPNFKITTRESHPIKVKETA